MPESLSIDDLLEDECLAELVRDDELGVRRWMYEDGEIVLREGERATQLYVLESGALRIETGQADESDQGRILATVISEKDRRRAFGEMAFFLDGVRTATVRSVGSSRVLEVQETGITLLFRRFPDLVLELFSDLVSKLRLTTESFEAMRDAQEIPIEEIFIGSEEAGVFLEIGDRVDRLYRVTSGTVRLVDSEGKEERVSDNDSKGSFLLATAFLRGELSEVRIEVDAGTVLQSIDSASREAVIRAFPELALAIIDSLEAPN
ncbi:MAG: cyclic nucleotide-binding domain-containing protein [Planctomycetota bacterium]|jgi:CRP-like cAMP-binding protein|nr:cyclic nucleotide-binding domain-containing protein [Planctomycetota bacterium]